MDEHQCVICWDAIGEDSILFHTCDTCTVMILFQ